MDKARYCEWGVSCFRPPTQTREDAAMGTMAVCDDCSTRAKRWQPEHEKVERLKGA